MHSFISQPKRSAAWMKAVEELEKHQKLLADKFSSDEEPDDEMNGIPNNFKDVRVSLTRISELNFDEGNRNVPAILPVTRFLIITQRNIYLSIHISGQHQ